MLWAKLTDESALSINSRFALHQITLADIVDEAASWPLDRAAAEQVVTETIERMRTGAKGLRFQPLATIIGARCEALLSGRHAGA